LQAKAREDILMKIICKNTGIFIQFIVFLFTTTKIIQIFRKMYFFLEKNHSTSIKDLTPQNNKNAVIIIQNNHYFSIVDLI
jgi:hypothetical protein